MFFQKAEERASGVASIPPAPACEDEERLWSPKTVRTVPAFYPLEKSSRFIEDDHLAVASRLAECCRVLSVQAIYNDENATASLVTGENVEMHLSLWRTSGNAASKYPAGIVVELQRRKGDSIIFHRYSRYILDAAMDEFDPSDFKERTGGDVAQFYTRKAERMLKMQTGGSASTEEENAIIAIEIAHGLLMKDRMDARQLGLESLCLLTDSQKTGSTTALIASHVVLLGSAQGTMAYDVDGTIYDESPFQEIRETILSLIQLRRIGDEAGYPVADDENLGGTCDGEFEGQHTQEKEHMSILHNLALAVLANALKVIEDYDACDPEPEETYKPRVRLDSSEITKTFMNEGKDITSKEILSTLISELGKASRNPHNACLSAKCLSSLMGASDDARRRAKELGAKNVVSTALDVGVRTHAKLETECQRVVTVMTQVREEDPQLEQQQELQFDEMEDDENNVDLED